MVIERPNKRVKKEFTKERESQDWSDALGTQIREIGEWISGQKELWSFSFVRVD